MSRVPRVAKEGAPGAAKSAGHCAAARGGGSAVGGKGGTLCCTGEFSPHRLSGEGGGAIGAWMMGIDHRMEDRSGEGVVGLRGGREGGIPWGTDRTKLFHG